MSEQAKARRFEQMALAHLDAAHNLARWLTRNDHDAEDVVQEAYLRAFKYFDGYQGGNGKAWILAIVRRTCFTWLGRNRPKEVLTVEADVLEAAAERAAANAASGPEGPEAEIIRRADKRAIDAAIAALPAPYREVLVLRELEDMAYKEIATVTGIPIGTVMSRLARARALLREALGGALDRKPAHGM
ncbi:MAG TPA: sigma-70 family RNA polymerase sigma factor [Candidatus Cybelea sp.]|nr:sigma-70 family RNA polymerase sigma factor [Candidatus Cybelea sp.]